MACLPTSDTRGHQSHLPRGSPAPLSPYLYMGGIRKEMPVTIRGGEDPGTLQFRVISDWSYKRRTHCGVNAACSYEEAVRIPSLAGESVVESTELTKIIFSPLAMLPRERPFLGRRQLYPGGEKRKEGNTQSIQLTWQTIIMTVILRVQ